MSVHTWSRARLGSFGCLEKCGCEGGCFLEPAEAAWGRSPRSQLRSLIAPLPAPLLLNNLKQILLVLRSSFLHSLSKRILLFSRSVLSDSLRPHGLQHARLPCPSPTPGLAQTHVHRVDDAIQPSHPLSSPSPALNLPASQSYPMRRFIATGGQNIGASAPASVLPMNIQGSFPLGLSGLISLQSKGLSGVFTSTTVLKHQFSSTLPPLWSNSQICT